MEGLLESNFTWNPALFPEISQVFGILSLNDLLQFLDALILALWIFIAIYAPFYRRRLIQTVIQRKSTEWTHLQLPKKEIRYRGRLYNVSKFVGTHPGGNVIEFYVNNGEDATEAIEQFHFRARDKVRRLMQNLPSRREAPGESFPGASYPGGSMPLENAVKHKGLSRDFEKLFLEVVEGGYFQPDLPYAVWRILEIVFLLLLGVTLASPCLLVNRFTGYGWAVNLLGAGILGICQIRSSYLMHEGGHNSLTGRNSVDHWVQSALSGLTTGFSASCYRHYHQKHHSMPQRIHHDYDLHATPEMAAHVELVPGRKNGISLVMRHQAHLLVPFITTTFALGWKLCFHPIFVWRRGLYTELLFMMSHYLLVYHVGLSLYMLSVIISMSVILTNVSLTHLDTPLAHEGTHWVEYASVHTSNVHPSWWCDWWMGHLNYQIEHHLFPTLPAQHLRSVSGRVKEFLGAHDLPYATRGYVRGIWNNYCNFRTVSHILAKMKEM